MKQRLNQNTSEKKGHTSCMVDQFVPLRGSFKNMGFDFIFKGLDFKDVIQ